METFNQFMVGLQGGKLAIMNKAKLMTGITPDEARNLAAWLVTLADVIDPTEGAFDKILAAIQNT